MRCSCGFPEAVPLASTGAKRANSRENGQKPKIPYGNDAPRSRERNLDLPFLPRPRSLETRKQRRFPHSHRDDCCCDPLELKPEPRMNTGDVTDSCTEPIILGSSWDHIYRHSYQRIISGSQRPGVQEKTCPIGAVAISDLYEKEIANTYAIHCYLATAGARQTPPNLGASGYPHDMIDF